MKYLFLTFLISLNAFAICNSTFDPGKASDFEKSKLEYNGQKLMGSIPANSSVNLDLPLVDDSLLTGAKLILNNNCIGDMVKFQVVHPTLGVLKTFIDWYAFDTDKELLYPAKLVCGLIIRINYTNTCSSGVTVRANLSLHKVIQ